MGKQFFCDQDQQLDACKIALLIRWNKTRASGHIAQYVVEGFLNHMGMSAAPPVSRILLNGKMYQFEGNRTKSTNRALACICNAKCWVFA